MKAIATIAFAATLPLIAVTAITVFLFGGEAVEEGKSLHLGRRLVSRAAKPRSAEGPVICWIGDSTMMRGPKRYTPYPILVAKRFGDNPSIETRLFTMSAVGPFVDYVAMGKLLEADPDLIVMVANLRIMALRGDTTRGVLGMASFIPASEMWRAAWLPWHHRQVTIPRLFLARAMAWRPFEYLVYFYEGLRLMFREELYSSSLKLAFADGVARRNVMVRNYAEPIPKPVYRMLGAAVDLAVRRGRRVVVMLTPMPLDRLRKLDLYNDDVLERIEVVRHTVEQAGGRFVDFHDALPPELFRDTAGHFNGRGVERVAEMLEPIVREELSDRWPTLQGAARAGGRRILPVEPARERR